MPDDTPDPKKIGKLIREKMTEDEEYQEGQKSRFTPKAHLPGIGGSWREPNADLSREFDGKTAFRNTKDKGSPYEDL